VENISDERIENGFILKSRHLVRKSNTEEVRVFSGPIRNSCIHRFEGERHEPSTTLASRRCRSIDRQPPLLPLEPGQLASICLAVSSAGFLDDRLRRVGAITYNAVHTYVGPLVLAGYAFESNRAAIVSLSLIWIAHIGLDRMLEFGLKYPTRFNDTHLNPDPHTLSIGN
jgi:hypothetical protein